MTIEMAAIRALLELIDRFVATPPFQCGTIPVDPTGHDVFEIESRAGKVMLRGNNGASMASAFNGHLKHCTFNRFGQLVGLAAVGPRNRHHGHERHQHAVAGTGDTRGTRG